MTISNQNIIPEISELYTLNQKDYNFACSILGNAFRVDPIWREILKDDPSKFSQVFGVPLKYTLKYGRVFAPNNEKLAIAAWLPSQFVEMTGWRMLRSGAIFAAMQLGANIGNKISQVFSIIDKDRKSNIQGQYVYLYVLGVSPSEQGKGLGTLLVKKMIDYLPSGIPLYLETETESNVKFYERLGFQVVNKIQIPVVDLPMWEMIHPGK
jgi:ribosomal protein S18 acetylase RimI-like enzyme